ncbi:MAG: TspO/MBR family protein [Halobaculum sp.]|jgi:tryptophan-rich sensory protein
MDTRAVVGGITRRLQEPLGLVALILLVNLVGAAPSLLAGPGTPWFEQLTKPAIYPPPVTFGVVWTALFTLQGIAVWLVVREGEGRRRLAAVALFGGQFCVNLAWTPTFFGLRAIGVALAVALALVPLVALTARSFAKIDRRAGLLLVPYLVWAGFAVVLTYRFLVVN